MSEPTFTPRNLTVLQLCQQENISRSRLYAEMNAGRLVPLRFGRAVRFAPKDVATWRALCRGDAEPTPAPTTHKIRITRGASDGR
jgi:predicted DNA-binding transcriptional regulator AlpA